MTAPKPVKAVPLPMPAPAHVDARSRALRTLAQGLLTTVAAAVVSVILASTGTIEWTSAYWATLGVSVGQAALTAGISYIARHVVPPATG